MKPAWSHAWMLFAATVVAAIALSCFSYRPVPSIESRGELGHALDGRNGAVVFGLTGDAPSTEDLGVLAAGIEDGMLELLRAAEMHSPTGRVG